MMRKTLIGFVAVLALALSASGALAANSGHGFDQFGYNNAARVFVGTYTGYCVAGGGTVSSCSSSPYANDRLVMKWNAAWDACNAHGYDNPAYCAGAWVDNEWNGMVPGGSGTTEHYKIIWVGSQGENSPYWKAGGASVWGNYEILMDQGMTDGVHYWNTHSTPNGYGGN